MSIRLEDLPPKAREQAARKLLDRESACRHNPQAACGVRPPERGHEGKYHNQKAMRVMEDGTEIKFDSQKEPGGLTSCSACKARGRFGI